MAFWKTLVTGAAVAAISAGAAFAETIIRVQSVIPAKADEVHMLNEFAKDVAALTNGSLKIEVLPAGAVVGVKETLDAVDSGLIEGGFDPVDACRAALVEPLTDDEETVDALMEVVYATFGR